jgi:hypothetical protein
MSHVKDVLEVTDGGARLESGPDGYLLKVDPDCVDVHRLAAFVWAYVGGLWLVVAWTATSYLFIHCDAFPAALLLRQRAGKASQWTVVRPWGLLGQAMIHVFGLMRSSVVDR